MISSGELEVKSQNIAQQRRLSWRSRNGRLSQVSPQNGAELAAMKPAQLLRTETFNVCQRDASYNKWPVASVPAHQVDLWLCANERTRSILASSKRRLARSLSKHGSNEQALLRGKYGESLVHALLVNHSNEHLILFVLLCKLAPELLLDTFQSERFKNLGVMHLIIANANQRLLDFLLELPATCCNEDCNSDNYDEVLLKQQLTSALVEQRVTGSLFRPPSGYLAPNNACEPSGATTKPTSAGSWPCQQFWCDQLEHWPTANGRNHLILFDRIKSLAAAAANAAVTTLPQQQQQASNGSSKAQAQHQVVNSSSLAQVIYLGQTPLGWTIAFNSRDMFELLAQRGSANVLSRDSDANNCLHQVIINNQLNWTRFLVKFSGELERQQNKLGLTPFQLACHLGRVELFSELLEQSAVEFWTYSSVRCCAYPLASLDSLIVANNATPGSDAIGASAAPAPNAPVTSSATNSNSNNKLKRRPRKSAVALILESTRSSDEQKAALLSTGVIKRLLEEKWKIFARRLFYTDLLLTLSQLVMMTFACLMRPARVNLNYLDELAATSSKLLATQTVLQTSVVKLALVSFLVLPMTKSEHVERESRSRPAFA